MTGQPTFPTLLERFFTQRLMQQRQASAHTIASYRDTFRLLLQFAQKRLRRAPSTLALEDIDAPLVVDFLDELEKVRDVTARTRNLRLTEAGRRESRAAARCSPRHRRHHAIFPMAEFSPTPVAAPLLSLLRLRFPRCMDRQQDLL